MNAPAFFGEEASATAVYAQRTAAVTVRGWADARVARELEMLLDLVDAHARTGAIDHVVVDLRVLDFMSSACFKGFVTWLVGIVEGPPDQLYRVTILPDFERRWQRRSLAILASFAEEIVTIQE